MNHSTINSNLYLKYQLSNNGTLDSNFITNQFSNNSLNCYLPLSSQNEVIAFNQTNQNFSDYTTNYLSNLNNFTNNNTNFISSQSTDRGYMINQAPKLNDSNTETMENFGKIEYPTFTNSQTQAKIQPEFRIEETNIKPTKKSRVLFSQWQINELEKLFKKQKYVTSNERELISKRLKLHANQVKIWFQNRRYKIKKRNELQRE